MMSVGRLIFRFTAVQMLDAVAKLAYALGRASDHCCRIDMRQTFPVYAERWGAGLTGRSPEDDEVSKVSRPLGAWLKCQPFAGSFGTQGGRRLSSVDPQCKLVALTLEADVMPPFGIRCRVWGRGGAC